MAYTNPADHVFTAMDIRQPGGIWIVGTAIWTVNWPYDIKGARYVSSSSVPQGQANGSFSIIPAPMALPGQWIVYRGTAYQVSALVYGENYRRHRLQEGWQYKVHESYEILMPEDIQPHPRPDHGGPLLSVEAEAQRQILELQTHKLESILEIVRPPPKPPVVEPVVEEAQEDFLSVTAEGAKNGVAAAVFVVLAEKLKARYTEYIRDSWVPALPWVLCSAVYIGTLLLDNLPMAKGVQAIALRGAAGTATMMTVRLAKPISEFVDRVLSLEGIHEL